MKALQDSISSLFYKHGLFCASHPFAIITLVILIALLICSPLTKLPLPGNVPQKFTTPVDGYKIPLELNDNVLASNSDSDELKKPRWYFGSPLAYIQQIVVKTVVSPWKHKHMIPTDTIRAPLSQVFDLIEHIQNFRSEHEKSLSDYCLHVSEVLRENVHGLLPEYNCLILSPANFWMQDKHKFADDGQIVDTLLQTHMSDIAGVMQLKDILFGVAWKQTGIQKYFFRNRQRVITLAVTLVLNKYDARFISALEKRLNELYPLSVALNSTGPKQLVHVHYKNVNYFAEYTPLLVAYVVLFLYIYFSVAKIEMVKSKWGLALSAVVTVVSSLIMSVSICVFFGLTPSLNGSEIFPYLVVIIGLENVLVVTKSVVSTPAHLEVKLRVAEGLSKEGWYIFKNLMTEFFVLAIGFLTFVPAIQEFCLFGVVGLMTDFFLQMFFFTTVLSIDIRRMELSDFENQKTTNYPNSTNHSSSIDVSMTSSTSAQSQNVTSQIEPSSQQSPVYSSLDRSSTGSPFFSFKAIRSRSAKSYLGSFGGGHAASHSGHSMMSRGHYYDDQYYEAPMVKLPRRMMVLNFWARTRVFQRTFMVFLVIWIALIIYKTVLVDLPYFNITQDDNRLSRTLEKFLGPNLLSDSSKGLQHLKYRDLGVDARVQAMIYHDDTMTWRKLSHHHWPTLFSYYNISLLGRYISILFSMHLSSVISPESAVRLRHSSEIQQWSAAGADQSDRLADLWWSNEDGEEMKTGIEDRSSINISSAGMHLVKFIERLMIYPRTGAELVSTVAFVIATLVVFTYSLASCYKCLCSRNYARWRRSWSRQRSKRSSIYSKQIRPSLPLILQGHKQPVECIATDGSLIVSCCLSGELRVWDSMSGECLTVINRKSLSESPRTANRSIENLNKDRVGSLDDDPYLDLDLARDESVTSDQRSHRPRSHNRHKSIDYHFLPDLTETIETDFGTIFSEPPKIGGTIREGIGSRVADSNPVGFGWTESKTEISDSRNGGGDRKPEVLWSNDSSVQLNQFPTDREVLNQGAEVERGRKGEERGERKSSAVNAAYDFSKFDAIYEQHKRLLEEQRHYELSKKIGVVSGKQRSLSIGSRPNEQGDIPLPSGSDEHVTSGAGRASPIWCLTSRDHLIIAGCANGTVEFWDGRTGALKFTYTSKKNSTGVTSICLADNRVMVAKLNGYLDFLQLETFQSSLLNTPPPYSLSFSHNRNEKVRHHSLHRSDLPLCDVITCTLLASLRVHQRPITIVQSEGGRVVTASEDHTLKVFRLEDSLCVFTLHGHTGAVTALHLDKISPLSAVSGSEDCTVRVWDLLTGSCVHRLHGHRTTVTLLACTRVHIISSGSDDRLCIWERYKGQQLHWIQMDHGYCTSLAMLTNDLFLTGGQGRLLLWDVIKGEVLRQVELNEVESAAFVHQLFVNGNTVVCNYGNQLQVIQFPSVLEKSE